MKGEGLCVAVAVVFFGMGTSRAAGQTVPIVVAAGANLQAALNQAQPGQVVEVQAGATFDGNFILPVKTGTGCSGTFGGRILIIGEVAISPSSTSQRKSC